MDRLAGQIAAQIFRHFRGRRITIRRPFFQRRQANHFQVAVNPRIDAARRRRIAGANLIQHRRGTPHERQLPGKTFVEHGAQTVHVAAPIDVVGRAGGLFGAM